MSSSELLTSELVRCLSFVRVDPCFRARVDGLNVKPKLSDYEQKAQAWLDMAEEEMKKAFFPRNEAEWNYMTNLTIENDELKILRVIEYEAVKAALGSEAFEKFDLNLIQDRTIKRAMESVQQERTGLSSEQQEKRARLSSQLYELSSSAKVCLADEPCKASDLIPVDEMNELYANSFDNASNLLTMWQKYHDAVPKEFKGLYHSHADLLNIDAQNKGFSSRAQRLLYEYSHDDPNFRSDLDELWLEVLPFYEDIHAYVRYHLFVKFGPRFMTLNRTIPGHLQGNLLNIGFQTLFWDVMMFKNVSNGKPSVHQSMLRHGWTEETIFEAAETFFKSLGFPKLNTQFWSKSMLKKPQDGRSAVCHPFAEGFDKGDQRILMCTSLDKHSFNTAHHEMGHVYYFMAYENQSIFFQHGANPAFHEAVGDTIFLSARQDSYWKQLDLLPKEFTASEEHKLNSMMFQALLYVSHLPFAYVLDAWRWEIYEGRANVKNSNDRYWELFRKYQGVHRPVPPGDHSFDLAFLIHVAKDIPYIRYFVSFLLKYQFHDALCTPNGTTEQSLHECTIYGNKEAGNKLWNMMKLGNREPWPEALKTLTGTNKLSFRSLNKYFAPLRKWLRKENERLGLCVGWGAKWPAKAKLHGPRCY